MSLLRPAAAAEFDTLWELLAASFPPDERRPRAGQRALLKEPAYTLYTNADVTALLAVWQWPELRFLEHFAVAPALRGQGRGTALLQELLTQLGPRLCLEVEPPESSPLAARRAEFYRRNGLALNAYPYRQPPLGPGQSGLQLCLMTSGGPATPEEFKTMRDILYVRVYHQTK